MLLALAVDIKMQISHHFVMRTTVSINDDLLEQVHHYARGRGLRFSRAVEELLGRGLRPRPLPATKNTAGWFTIELPPGSPVITTERVLELEREMEDEEDARKWSPSST